MEQEGIEHKHSGRNLKVIDLTRQRCAHHLLCNVSRGFAGASRKMDVKDKLAFNEISFG